MLILRIAFSLSLLSGRQAVIMAHRAARTEHRLTIERAASVVRQHPGVHIKAPKPCAMVAESVRGWGWGGEERDVRSTPIGAIVSAVNYQLRINAGQLGPDDLARLKLATLSEDPCLRELATSVLGTQTNKMAPKQSVTRSSEKQSLTREGISP